MVKRIAQYALRSQTYRRVRDQAMPRDLAALLRRLAGRDIATEGVVPTQAPNRPAEQQDSNQPQANQGPQHVRGTRPQATGRPEAESNAWAEDALQRSPTTVHEYARTCGLSGAPQKPELLTAQPGRPKKEPPPNVTITIHGTTIKPTQQIRIPGLLLQSDGLAHIVPNTAFTHGDPRARPFRIEDYRYTLEKLGALPEAVASGSAPITTPEKNEYVSEHMMDEADAEETARGSESNVTTMTKLGPHRSGGPMVASKENIDENLPTLLYGHRDGVQRKSKTGIDRLYRHTANGRIGVRDR
ncbi:hypothetical protein HPB50_026372 [Hyalomma asiaticum]|uniref:Uncharacterized protein n=1 Tax=Hyalomma asiaticum TaxID=266040 RepID=A0ACB7TRI7_HYAAI|nr:hypothetical protein HPB50_026372 [Hyalomma asiaticum]